MHLKTDLDKFSKILAEGGVLVLHKNDFAKLKGHAEAAESSSRLNWPRVYEDKLGAVKEGEVLVVRQEDLMANIWNLDFQAPLIPSYREVSPFYNFKPQIISST